MALAEFDLTLPFYEDETEEEEENEKISVSLFSLSPSDEQWLRTLTPINRLQKKDSPFFKTKSFQFQLCFHCQTNFPIQNLFRGLCFQCFQKKKK